MSLRVPLFVSVAIVAGMLAASVMALFLLPPHTAIPIHWGIEGRPDRFATGFYAVFVAPAVAALVASVFVAIPVIEPRRLHLESSAKFYRTSWIALMLFLAVVHGLALYAAGHPGSPMGSVIAGGVSLLLVVTGNYLGKTRSMFFAGLRTPWTLASEYSWQHTHALAGKLFIAAGVVSFVAAITLPMPEAMRLLIFTVAGAAALSIAASYVFWRRDPARNTTEPNT